jgi:leucine dehydrogenase
MSELLEAMAGHGTTELRAFRDEAAGLRGFVAVHDTTLGPAAGGTRRYAFDSEAAAIEDVLRLSRAMTYKFAISGIDLGGGKAVIWSDDDEPSEALYRAYGRVIDGFEGRFLTGGDVGTGVRELRWIARETDYVVGMPEQFDHPEGYHGGGLGLLRAIEAAADHVYDDRDPGELHVAIQGIGEMGRALARYLADAGARLTVADTDGDAVDRAVEEFGATAVDPGDVHAVDCDVFAPCALGGVLNGDTIPRLNCDVVAGAANNQLADEREHARLLHDSPVTYVPDYLANSGRTIDDTDLLRPGGYSHERARAMIDGIYDRTLAVLERSAREDTPTQRVADRMAEERIAAVGDLRDRPAPRRPSF